MTVIELERLGKTFGRGDRAVEAVRGIDLAVPSGQVFGFLGPNGAGKSTSIRMIMDLIRPTAGRVLLFGQDVRSHPQLLRRVGALVEGASLYDHLTGRRNLEVLARTAGHYSKAEVDAVLERVGMGDRADRAVGGYSMGMKQRLGVAAALLGNPELVVLDEPTNGLDPAGIREMRSFVRQLVEQDGLTVFLSSHLLTEVEQVCDRLAIIHHGKIVREGAVAEILAEETRLRVAVSEPERAAALLAESWPCQVRDGGLSLDAGREAAPEIVRRLVAAKVDVFEVRHVRRSLEEYFLELTEGTDTEGREEDAGTGGTGDV